jgi:tRNA(Met) cytidine acetyltransferase
LSAAGTDAAVRLALALRKGARRSRHRRLLLLEGEADWGQDAARAGIAACGPDRVCWSSGAGAGAGPVSSGRARRAALLGGECDLLVIDALGGLDADALGAAAGALQGGGLLLLLTPPLEGWPARTDPEAGRVAVYPFGAADVGRRFIARLARLLAASPAVARCPQTACAPPEPGDVLPVPAGSRASPAVPEPPTHPGAPATEDQQRAVDGILRVAEGRARRPLVLSSDRGRGKSAALGIAAGQLLARSTRSLCVTAPRRTAVQAVFDHARAVDDQAAGRLCFVAPDALLRAPVATDLLLIDEAAGIPAPVLESLLKRYPRVVFATTVHGYEGTGRGFELRFRDVLDRLTPGWRLLRLRAPIRWAAGDPLERLIDEALLLDAEPMPDDVVADRLERDDRADVRFERLDPDRLVADEPLLRQVFGLLVLAHYQTRPADLRHLLDGPNIDVAVLRDGAIVLATALLAREGGLPDALLGPIFDGRRRPRGHLLAQTLSAHAGLFDAPRLGYVRIVRIAVHPAARRRGLGTRLVAALAGEAERTGRDLLGASFGATPSLLRFWRRCGLLPVQLGSHRNAASGGHAAVVLRPVSERGQLLFERARRRLAPRLAVLLGGPLRGVEPAVVAELLQGAPTSLPPLDADEARDLGAFAAASRGFEAALPALHRLVRLALPGALQADVRAAAQAPLLIAAVLQQRSPAELAGELGYTGRRALLDALRSAAGALLEHVRRDAPIPRPPASERDRR